MASEVVKKWKKKTYIEAEILVTDWFYAKTPDLSDSEVWPFTKNAEKKIISKTVKRSTIEEVDLVLEKELNETNKEVSNDKISEEHLEVPEIKTA